MYWVPPTTYCRRANVFQLRHPCSGHPAGGSRASTIVFLAGHSAALGTHGAAYLARGDTVILAETGGNRSKFSVQNP